MSSKPKILGALVGGLCLLLIAGPSSAQVKRQVLNNGQLVLEDIPPIPEQIKEQLNRYQNVRSASFQAWTSDSSGIYVTTRFGDVNQIHFVPRPNAARKQLTFFDEPIQSISRQPNGDLLAFSMDAGGSENSQVFLLDPNSGDVRRISDGQSRNGTALWRRDGSALVYSSTRRNGASNDLWLTELGSPDSGTPDRSKLLLQSKDGSWWGPTDWSADGRKLLVQQYLSVTDSRMYLLDVQSGEMTLLRGSAEQPSVNFAVGFDKKDKGYYFLTDEKDEYAKLAYQRLDQTEHVVISYNIPWDVDKVIISEDRTRVAFSVNAGGLNEVYLMSGISGKFAKPASSKRLIFKLNENGTRDVFRVSVADAKFERITGLPVGTLSNMGFSPDGKKLALSLNTAKSPNDSYVLELTSNKLKHRDLTRWTFSEAGGLVSDTFVEPELIEYPSFDNVLGTPRKIPAFVYRAIPNNSKPGNSKPGNSRPGNNNQKAPVVVSIHGGPESQYRPQFNANFQLWISQLGAAVIAPNVRGSAGYGGQYVSLDNTYNREDSVKDIGALLEWIATQPDLDEKRVIVIGNSYGGYMSLASAVHYSDRLVGAIDVVGISNFVSYLENTKDYRREQRRPEYGDERDPEMRAFLQKISPNNNVDKIRVPLFVVQGQNDPRVPASESEQIVTALRKQGNEVWYMNALNEGHGYRKKENDDIFQQVVVMFMKKQFGL